MRSKGFWPLAHSSKSVGKRERLAHKASDLDKTVLTTVKPALTVLNTALGKPSFKKKSILRKSFTNGGRGSSGFHTSIFFLISNVNAPTYKQKKNKLS